MSRAELTALARRPAHELRDLIATRAVSPVEVLDASFAAYEELNPALNAIITPTFDRARLDARSAEEQVKRGEPTGPLHGLPLAVKDSVETAGVRTTYGSPLFRDHVPTADALHVQRLLAAGAILVGKTNTPELEAGINTRNQVFGQTLNPWDVGLGCGGSSGGAAVAVATGMCAIADGTDHGGSIRIPASVTGVVGLRPSPGRIPRHPSNWVFDAFSVPGPLARSVRDAALLLSVMAGPDARIPISLRDPAEQFADPVRDVRGWRIAWSRDLGGVLAVEPDVAAAVEKAARSFEELGCEVQEVHPDWRGALQIIAPLRAYRTAIVTDDLRARASEIANSFLRDFITRASELSLLEVGEAEARRSRMWERTAAFFASYRILLLPSTQWPAFPKDLDFPPTIAGRRMSGVVEAILSTYAVSIVGLPALSVPCGLTAAGLPIGLQLVGGWGRDVDVLAAGVAFEDAVPATRWTPPAPRPQNRLS